ncbi:MAG: hypothetical protein EBZ78_03915 [Verrucomicrobia bacterium]|nr:hypothetical protein [Verrucomicrobiota bacterium]
MVGVVTGGSEGWATLYATYDFSSGYTNGNLVGQNSWTQVGTGSTGPIQVTNGLVRLKQTTTNAVTGGVQNAYQVITTLPVSGVTTNTTYYYVLEKLNVLSAYINSGGTSGSGIATLCSNNAATGSFARLYIKRTDLTNTGTYVYGLQVGTNAAVYGTNSFAIGSTNKIVVTYDVLTSGTDSSSLFINPIGINRSNWTNELTVSLSGPRPTSFQSFSLQQGAQSTGTNNATLSRVLIGDSVADVLPLPNAPASSAATSPGAGGFTANWAASSGATGYYLDVATDSGFTTFLSGYNGKDVGAVNSASVTGTFSGGTTLYYRVRAYNSSGSSANSDAQTVSIVAAFLPTVSNGEVSGTVSWTNGPGWSPNNPVSATNATVTFNGALTGGTLNANNDSTGNFKINSLVFANTGSGNVNVTGNPFQLSSNGTTNPTITFANNTALIQRVSNALQLDAPLTVSQPGATTANSILEGVISGTSGMTKSGAGFVYLTGTNNSFSGGVAVGNGTLVVGNIGMAGSNSSLGTNGTITLGGSGISGTLRWGDYATGNEVSDKAISLPGSTGGGTIDVRGSSYYLTLNGNIDTGTNISARTFTLTGNGQNVGMNGATNSLVVNGLISGNGGLTVNGSGNRTVVLANTSNSFGGAFSISGSTGGQTYKVKIANIGNPGANSSIGTNGTINIGNNTANTFNMLTYTGSGETTDKTLNMAGTLGPVNIVNNGPGTLKFNNPVTITAAGAKTFYPDQDQETGVMEFAGNIPDSSAGATTIKKAGAGKLVLSASNSFTGGMRLAGGTLELLHPSALAAGNYLKYEAQATNGVALVKIGYSGNGPDLANLQVLVDGTINLGTDASASIRFATANTWTAGKVLTVANSTGGGKMYILNSAGLDLSQIKSLEHPTWPASLDANGLLTFTAPAPANTAPSITSGGAFSVSENIMAVTTVTATDAEGNTLSYGISGGADADKFWIDSGTGVLTFLSAPNFESPTDAGADNVYNVTVQVTDGTLTGTKDIAVTVTNVSDSPADFKADWLAANGLPGSSGWNSDPNNVGYSLATAYAFGLSPSVNSGAPVALASSSAGSVKIVYLQKDNSGVIYAVKSGTDLAAGLSGTVTPMVSAVQPSPGKSGYTQYEATYTPGGSKGFLKVQADVP